MKKLLLMFQKSWSINLTDLFKCSSLLIHLGLHQLNPLLLVWILLLFSPENGGSIDTSKNILPKVYIHIYTYFYIHVYE